MNRKNTILIAVLINIGLLAVLLIAALTTQDELAPASTEMADSLTPKFDDQPIFNEIPVAALPEKMSPFEIPVQEIPLHKLPPLALEVPPLPEPSTVASTAPSTQLVVQKGDNLEKIAKANHTTVQEIIKLNQLPSSFLKVGQILKIPTERSLPKIAEKKQTADLGPEYYTLKVGDNPWAIAMKHHMKVDELLRLNGLNEERARKLKAGDRLRIR